MNLFTFLIYTGKKSLQCLPDVPKGGLAGAVAMMIERTLVLNLDNGLRVAKHP